MYAGHCHTFFDMDHYAFHHNWIISNHNRWANIVPETVRAYHVWVYRSQVVRCLAYIYNAAATHNVDTTQQISTLF